MEEVELAEVLDQSLLRRALEGEVELLERIAVADGSLDVPTRGLVEQRQGELERGRGLLGLVFARIDREACK